MCEKFVKSEFPLDHSDADRFIKERISFVELAMRRRYEEIETININLSKAILNAKIRDSKVRRGISISGFAVDGVKALNKTQNDIYSSHVNEINERFRRAKT